LRQQIAKLQSENAALKRAGAGAGGSGADATVGEDAVSRARWQLMEQMQQDMSSLEMENAKLKVQLVRQWGGASTEGGASIPRLLCACLSDVSALVHARTRPPPPALPDPPRKRPALICRA
jgi:hypothetical protein